MSAVGVVSFVAGMLFLVLGAWPVFGFFGLDVLLLYWAFRINYARAAAYEVVTVTPIELRVRKVSHRGRVREWVLNPLWVRLDKAHASRNTASNGCFWCRAANGCRLRQFPRPGRKGLVRQGAGQRAGRGQARRDTDRPARQESGG